MLQILPLNELSCFQGTSELAARCWQLGLKIGVATAAVAAALCRLQLVSFHTSPYLLIYLIIAIYLTFTFGLWLLFSCIRVWRVFFHQLQCDMVLYKLQLSPLGGCHSHGGGGQAAMCHTAWGPGVLRCAGELPSVNRKHLEDHGFCSLLVHKCLKLTMAYFF